MSDELAPTPSQFLVYRDEAGEVRLDVRFDGDTVWLTQAQLAELFGTTPQNITQHIGAGGAYPGAGAEHPSTLTSRSNLASVLRELGRTAEAKELDPDD